MKRLISYVVAHTCFRLGDTIGWFEDWRTNSEGSWIQEHVSDWLIEQSYWVQEWGGAGPWYKPTDEQTEETTFDEND